LLRVVPFSASAELVGFLFRHAGVMHWPKFGCLFQ